MVPSYNWSFSTNCDNRVSIPSSSGQWFHLTHLSSAMYRQSLFQSLLHQVSGSICATADQAHKPMTGFNPFFIRSVVPSHTSWHRYIRPTQFQSLLHQVSGSIGTITKTVRSQRGSFQSLLHQVSGSITMSIECILRDGSVSIPSSSGQWFHQRNLRR